MKTMINALMLILVSMGLSAQNVGIGTISPNAKVHIEGDSNSIQSALRSHVNFSGLSDIHAVTGVSVPAPGWGYGGNFEGGYMGLYGFANASDYAGSAYGVYGASTGSTGTRIGIYGVASGGLTDWAGYFQGRGKFTDQLVLDKSLWATDYIRTDRNLIVKDTSFSSTIHSNFGQPYIRIKAARDILLTIDDANDSYTSALFIKNGAGNNVFGVDENGNARTFGDHYVDSKLGVGTNTPSQQLDVDNGNIVVQGTNSFLTTGDAGIVYLGSIHHYIMGEHGFGVKIGTYAVGDALVIKEITGDVAIGTITPANGYKLSVKGKIIGEELKIQNFGAWPDYVFLEDYELMSLDDLQHSIHVNGHLPGIPSADDLEKNGLMVGDMQKRMMQKIEELTLYVFQLNEKISVLTVKNEKLEHKIMGNK